MEVEAQCKAILKANAVPPTGKGYSITDYSKLAAVMKFGDYEIALAGHPSYPRVRPFVNWSISTPSLDWYKTYNVTKYDRERDFTRAELSHAINTVAAVEVLLIAQFGMADVNRVSDPSHMFTVHSAPTWPTADWYWSPIDGKTWTSVPTQL